MLKLHNAWVGFRPSKPAKQAEAAARKLLTQRTRILERTVPESACVLYGPLRRRIRTNHFEEKSTSPENTILVAENAEFLEMHTAIPGRLPQGASMRCGDLQAAHGRKVTPAKEKTQIESGSPRGPNFLRVCHDRNA